MELRGHSLCQRSALQCSGSIAQQRQGYCWPHVLSGLVLFWQYWSGFTSSCGAALRALPMQRGYIMQQPL